MSTYEISFDGDCKLHCPKKITFGSAITEILTNEELIGRVGEQIYGLWKILIEKKIRWRNSIQITLPERRVVCGSKTIHYAENNTPEEIFHGITSR